MNHQFVHIRLKTRMRCLTRTTTNRRSFRPHRQNLPNLSGEEIQEQFPLDTRKRGLGKILQRIVGFQNEIPDEAAGLFATQILR